MNITKTTMIKKKERKKRKEKKRKERRQRGQGSQYLIDACHSSYGEGRRTTAREDGCLRVDYALPRNLTLCCDEIRSMWAWAWA